MCQRLTWIWSWIWGLVFTSGGHLEAEGAMMNVLFWSVMSWNYTTNSSKKFWAPKTTLQHFSLSYCCVDICQDVLRRRTKFIFKYLVNLVWGLNVQKQFVLSYSWEICSARTCKVTARFEEQVKNFSCHLVLVFVGLSLWRAFGWFLLYAAVFLKHRESCSSGFCSNLVNFIFVDVHVTGFLYLGVKCLTMGRAVCPALKLFRYRCCLCKDSPLCGTFSDVFTLIKCIYNCSRLWQSRLPEFQALFSPVLGLTFVGPVIRSVPPWLWSAASYGGVAF